MSSTNYYPVRADVENINDLYYEHSTNELKEHVDLRNWATNVGNQSSLRSCTSEAVVGAYELLLKKLYPDKFVDLSALFVYYNARILEGAKPIADSGVYIRDALQSVHQQGICAESVWPYNLSQFSAVPTLASYEDAKTRTIKEYRRCKSFDDILDALSNNIPVVVSMKIYQNFNQIGWTGTSQLSMPAKDQDSIGGHSVVLVGYSNETQKLIARNSFGPMWGERGYFYMPYEYGRQNIIDAWVFDIAVE